ncbi:Flp pilus assembly protein CpaB [Novosphingobium sp.]|uniref:Flp pilus assembly protein CpaB n=1 Tax=Novosphingobium sp. TaxID=1874826 RepID=UPI002732D406|nr:Flp pilus assembly protein CpaB [Novosphingobium sp.]MDP3908080.1 Flp pilus assembly protein CpaB [Novosphingobium sp.]
MDKKKLMLLLGALVIAIGTAMAARNLLAGGSTPEAEAAQQMPQGPKVLVAQRGLPVGTILTADSVSFQQWPKEMVQDAYFLDGEADINKLLGTVVRYQVTAGQPLTQGALVAPGDRGFLAAALGAGMRAVTIPVSQKTGVAGFVFPGDHVDLMLTQTVKATDGGESLKTAETILRNVRVLATDQSTQSETKDNGKTVVRAFRTVTLEVTPKIAEKITVAQTLGTISLALRSIADNQAELDRAIASGSIKVPAGATREQEEALLKTALSRPNDGATTFVTGGDVSRFQRRTVPPTRLEAAKQMVETAVNAYADRAGAPLAAAPSAPVGPVVRVTRGKNTVEEQVGR